MANTQRGLVLGATALTLTTLAVTGAGILSNNSQAYLKESPKEVVDQVWHIIDNHYVDATFNQVDWEAVRNSYLSRDYSNSEQAYEAIREMLSKLEDPYTRFMSPKEFQNMQIDTSGQLTGVGIQIAKDEETEQIMVISPIEDTPAFQAGILAKDVITKIDGQSTEGMELNDAVDLIRGKEGTQVILTIKRNDQEIDYSITRAKIQIHPVRSQVEVTPQGKVGYIRLTQFSANAAREMRDAIKELEKQQVPGYVLDLRSNPGGLLNESIEIARMWQKEGGIVSTVSRSGQQSSHQANGRNLTDKPLVVLVDGGSASASEILSGALQDNDRAILVGTKTFGKGLVQSVRSLGDGSGMAVTIAKYLTPDGRDINKLGIEPDIIFELSDEQRKELQRDRTVIGTLEDPQFAKAVEILFENIAASN